MNVEVMNTAIKQNEAKVTKAEIIEAIYSSPEAMLTLDELRDVVLAKKGFSAKPAETEGVRDIDYSYTWQCRDMISSGMLGFVPGADKVSVIASIEQLRREYPPAKEPGFRLAPFKPTS